MNIDVFDKGAVHVLPEIDITNIRRKFLDIPYAINSEYQKFDLYLPKRGDGPFPCLFFIHGGGFRRGDKRDVQVQGFMKLLHKNYAVASINYRLSFETQFPGCVYDCKAAIRYIKAHASEYQIDPERVAVAGGSAGGYLSLLVATTGGQPVLEDLSMGNADQSSSVRCAVALFPETDFTTSFAQAVENEKNGIINLSDNSHDPSDPDAPAAQFLGGALETLKSDYLLSASPVAHISRQTAPVLLQHGKLDYHVPCQQSVEFYQKAKPVVGEQNVELDILETAIHMDAQFQTDENMERIEAFIAKHML